MKSAFIPFTALLCTGCVATAVVYGPDETPQGTYPDLHSVPDRPVFASPQNATTLEKDLEGGYEASLELNERLRRDALSQKTPSF